MRARRVPFFSMLWRLAARSASASRQKLQPEWRRKTNSTGRSLERAARLLPLLVSVSFSRVDSSGNVSAPASLRYAVQACLRMSAKGTHQMRSLVMQFSAKAHGNCSVHSAWIMPSGPKTFPRNPTSTIGQCRTGSKAAMA